MYGWKARIGVIVPSTNTVAETDYWQVIPEGVSVHSARVEIHETTPEALRKMAEGVEHASELLATAEVDIILFACTSGSFIGGSEWESGLVKRIEAASGIKAITTSGAVLKALKKMESRKITLVTPYINELNELEKSFFESLGYTIVSWRGLGIAKSTVIGRQTPDVIFRLVKDTVSKEADTIFISCTDFRSIGIIKTVESNLGMTCITSNQAGIWDALRTCGINEQIEGYGRLLML